MNRGLQTFTDQDVRELMASHRRAMATPQQWGYLSTDGASAAVISRVSWEIPRNGYSVTGWKIERSIRCPGGWVQEPACNTRTATTLAEAHQIARRFVGLSEEGGDRG